MLPDEKSDSDKRKDKGTIPHSESGFDQRRQKVEGDQYNIAGNINAGGGLFNSGNLNTGGGDVIGSVIIQQIHSKDADLPSEQVQELLKSYRQRIISETSWVNFQGIPLPESNANGTIKIPLQDVYIRLQALESRYSESQRRLLEEGVLTIATDSDGTPKLREHGPKLLSLIATLGEYFNRQGATIKQEERIDPVDLESTVKKHSRLVLLGAPGSGKSTLLRYLAHQIAMSDDEYIPVLFPLSRFALAQKQDANVSLRHQALLYASAGNPELFRALNQAVQTNTEKVYWLLDGLDEASESREVATRQINALPQEDHIVITSRPLGYDFTYLVEIPHFEILPLTIENTHKFIRDWLSTPAIRKERSTEWVDDCYDWLEQQLLDRPKLRALTSNPLLLTFLVILARHDPRTSLPKDRFELYQRYVDSLFIAWEDKTKVTPLPYSKRLYTKGIHAIGWYLHMAYFDRLTPNEIQFDQEKSVDYVPTQAQLIQWLTKFLQEHEADMIQGTPASKAAENVLEFWLQTGLLQEQPWGRWQFLNFRHLTFQEYCAALMLHDGWRNRQHHTWDFLKTRLHRAVWREPLLLLAEMMNANEVDQFIRSLLAHPSKYDFVLQRDVRLASMLIGETELVSEDITKLVIRRLSRLSRLRRWESIVYSTVLLLLVGIMIGFGLGIFGISRWFVVLTLLVWIAIWTGTFVLSVLPRIASLVGLPIRVLQQPSVVTWFIEALGNIRHQSSVDMLMSGFSLSQKDYIRYATAKALSRIGEPAIPALIEMAGDENEDIREVVKQALFKLGSVATKPLLQELWTIVNQDEEKSPHGADTTNSIISQALAKIGIQTEAREDNYDNHFYRYAVIIQVLGELKERGAVEPLLEMLKQKREPFLSVVRALESIGDERAIEILAQAIPSKEWDDDQIIIDVLENFGTAAVNQLIQVMFKSERFITRMRAAEALGRINDERAMHPLLNVVCRSNPMSSIGHDVEKKAAEALHSFGEAVVQPLIDALLVTEEDHVITFALQQLGEPAVQPLIRLLFTTDGALKRKIHRVLVGIGKEAVPYLVRELKTRDLNLEANDPLTSTPLRYMMSIIQILGKIGDNSAIPDLVEVLVTTPNTQIQIDCIYALDAIGDPAAAGSLIPFVKHPDYVVQYQAVTALGNLKEQTSVPFLIDLLESEMARDDRAWFYLDQMIVEALGAIGGDEAVSCLLMLFKGTESLHADVIQALGNARDPRATTLLIESLNYEDDAKDIIEALVQIGEPAIDFLVAELPTVGIATQERILVVLSQIKDSQSLIAFRDLLPSLEPSLRPQAEDYLSHLEYELCPKWWFDFQHIQRVLDTGDLAKISTLTTSLQYGLYYDLNYLGEYERADAVRGLVKADDNSSVSILRRLADRKEETEMVRSEVLAGLGKLAGEDALELLLSTLKNGHEEWRVRCSALDGLRWINNSGAKSAVEKALLDKDYYVCRHAIKVVQAWVEDGWLQKGQASLWLSRPLRKSIVNPVADSRLDIIRQLISTDVVHIIAPLVGLQYSYSPWLREYVLYAIGTLTAQIPSSQRKKVIRRLWWQLSDYGLIFFGRISPNIQALVTLEKLANEEVETGKIELF